MKIELSHDDWVSALSKNEISARDIVLLGKKYGAEFVWHPLGFILCKLSEEGRKKIRLHIWPSSNERVQKPVWLIHDHLFDLKSWVLSGAIENTEYEVTNSSPNFSVYQASYDQDKSILHRTVKKICIREKSKSVVRTGGIYKVASGVLHQSISLSESTSLTVCETIDCLNKTPIIAGDISGLDTYSYTRAVVHDSDLYSIIEEI